jgi:monofunctional biosynthetic peptidoglycan transglycosylase
MNEQNDSPKDESSQQGDRRRFRRRHLILLSISALVLIFFAYLAYLTVSLPAVEHLREDKPDATSLMRQRWNEARSAGKEPKRIQQWVSLDEISERIVQAVVMGEDASFFRHNGFDFYEIKESIRKNIERGRFARGASTITQQLAKNLFLSTERSLNRKLKEAILTYRLERDLSKRRILEIYLNVIEWGEDIYGVEAAARVYFGNRASRLDAAESALLAAMIPNPRRFHPSKNMEALKARQERILGWMKMAGHLSEDELVAARKQPLGIRVPVNSK